MGLESDVDLNFKIEVEPRTYYTPIMLASVIGYIPTLEILLSNPKIDINAVDEGTGCNSFWLASMYGKGASMSLLANKGIDILNKHIETGANALHVAV